MLGLKIEVVFLHLELMINYIYTGQKQIHLFGQVIGMEQN